MADSRKADAGTRSHEQKHECRQPLQPSINRNAFGSKREKTKGKGQRSEKGKENGCRVRQKAIRKQENSCPEAAERADGSSGSPEKIR